ncbi:MAG: hypothetical protein AAF126_24980, partial [Chloroflexota bacterium]
RKINLLFTVVVAIALFAIASVVSAADPENAAPAVPDGIATYLATNEVDLSGGNCGGINYANDNWGNGTRQLADGTWRITGEGVGGRCDVSPQATMDSLCRAGQVNTANRSWGNGSRIRGDGSLIITGAGVGGRCILTDANEIALARVFLVNAPRLR